MEEEKKETKKEEKVVKGRSTKSKAMTVLLGITFFCVLSILLLAILDDGTLLGGKDKPPVSTDEQQEKPKDDTPSNNNDSYTGKYVAIGEAAQDEEYFELFEDGKATIYTITGDNGAYEEISTYYNITTVDGTTILMFDEYNSEEPGNWYTYALDLTKTETGYKAIPSGYNNKCTGPSACSIAFEK